MKDKKNKVIAFKAFDENLKCRSFQYEIGETYLHDGKVELCSSGFHACINPLDCLSYYDLTSSKFALVEAINPISDGDDSKFATAEITIKAELKLPEFIKKSVEWVIDNCNFDTKKINSGDNAKQASSGDYAKQASSGDYAQQASSGYSAKQASSGDNAQHEASGENSVISSSGINSTAKGNNGTWISLAEFDNQNKCIGFAVGCVGEDGIEADVFYQAKIGKLVSVK